MKIDIYIPALLKFNDDTISISKDVQIDINKYINSPFSRNEEPDGFNYSLSGLNLKKTLENKDINDVKIKVYYYHHRIVFHYEIEFDDDLKQKFSSKSRKIIINHFNENIKNLITMINLGVQESSHFKNETIRNNTKVIYYYSYPIIFQKFNKSINKTLTSNIETMYFRIFLPNKNPFSFGSKAYVRISIPSFHLFYKSKLTNEIISNVINAVYQTVLYPKKTQDFDSCKEEVKNQSELKDSFSENLLEKYNIVDEKTLNTLWQHSMDSMGGKISDNQQAKVSKIMFFVSIFSLITAIISLLIVLFTKQG